MDPHIEQDRSATAGGLFHSLRNLLATLLGIVHTRLELLTTEIQEEVQGAAKLLLWAFIAALAAMMALFLAAFTVIFAFWEHRFAAALAMVALFVAIAVIAVLTMRHKLRTRSPLLDATLSELARDRDQLRARL